MMMPLTMVSKFLVSPFTFVSAGVDEGVIIAQESFERLPNDDLSQFKARGLSVEHQLYPNVLLSLSRGDFVTQSDPFSIFLTPSS